ncbi:MAG: hypothetical protein ACK53Y_25275, partial [bacterium]
MHAFTTRPPRRAKVIALCYCSPQDSGRKTTNLAAALEPTLPPTLARSRLSARPSRAPRRPRAP